jgi:hypothetical protein
MTYYTSRRGKTIFFPRSPPLNPPTDLQEYFRDLYRFAGTQWRSASALNRKNWNDAARRAHLAITGYNLWCWYCRFADSTTIDTIERQTGITLIRPLKYP